MARARRTRDERPQRIPHLTRRVELTEDAVDQHFMAGAALGSAPGAASVGVPLGAGTGGTDAREVVRIIRDEVYPWARNPPGVKVPLSALSAESASVVANVKGVGALPDTAPYEAGDLWQAPDGLYELLEVADAASSTFVVQGWTPVGATINPLGNNVQAYGYARRTGILSGQPRSPFSPADRFDDRGTQPDDGDTTVFSGAEQILALYWNRGTNPTREFTTPRPGRPAVRRSNAARFGMMEVDVLTAISGRQTGPGAFEAQGANPVTFAGWGPSVVLTVGGRSFTMVRGATALTVNLGATLLNTSPAYRHFTPTGMFGPTGGKYDNYQYLTFERYTFTPAQVADFLPEPWSNRPVSSFTVRATNGAPFGAVVGTTKVWSLRISVEQSGIATPDSIQSWARVGGDKVPPAALDLDALRIQLGL